MCKCEGDDDSNNNSRTQKEGKCGQRKKKNEEKQQKKQQTIQPKVYFMWLVRHFILCSHAISIAAHKIASSATVVAKWIRATSNYSIFVDLNHFFLFTLTVLRRIRRLVWFDSSVTKYVFPCVLQKNRFFFFFILKVVLNFWPQLYLAPTASICISYQLISDSFSVAELLFHSVVGKFIFFSSFFARFHGCSQHYSLVFEPCSYSWDFCFIWISEFFFTSVFIVVFCHIE